MKTTLLRRIFLGSAILAGSAIVFSLGGIYASTRAVRTAHILAAQELVAVDYAISNHDETEARRVISLAVNYHVGVFRTWHDCRWMDGTYYVKPWTGASEEHDATLDLKALHYYNTLRPLIEPQNSSFLASQP